MTTPTPKSRRWARTVASLLGAGTLALLVVLFASLTPFHGRLMIYVAILVAPLAGLGGWRLWHLWRLGFQRLPRPYGRRIWALGLALFASVVVLLYSFEGWRGRRAYAALAREVAAQGGSLEFAAVVPPPVPEAENLCATPLFKTLVAFDRPKGPVYPSVVRWRDAATIERLDTMRLPARHDSWHHARREEPPAWLTEFTHLDGWWQYLATNRAYAVSGPVTNAADGMLRALGHLDAGLHELHAASQRPHARWFLPYDEGWLAMVGGQDCSKVNVDIPTD